MESTSSPAPARSSSASSDTSMAMKRSRRSFSTSHHAHSPTLSLKPSSERPSKLARLSPEALASAPTSPAEEGLWQPVPKSVESKYTPRVVKTWGAHMLKPGECARKSVEQMELIAWEAGEQLRWEREMVERNEAVQRFEKRTVPRSVVKFDILEIRVDGDNYKHGREEAMFSLKSRAFEWTVESIYDETKYRCTLPLSSLSSITLSGAFLTLHVYAYSTALFSFAPAGRPERYHATDDFTPSSFSRDPRFPSSHSLKLVDPAQSWAQLSSLAQWDSELEEKLMLGSTGPKIYVADPYAEDGISHSTGSSSQLSSSVESMSSFWSNTSSFSSNTTASSFYQPSSSLGLGSWGGSSESSPTIEHHLAASWTPLHSPTILGALTMSSPKKVKASSTSAELVKPLEMWAPPPRVTVGVLPSPPMSDVGMWWAD